MALRIYSTIETDGPYPAVNAADVEMPDGSRLSEVEIGGGGSGGGCDCDPRLNDILDENGNILKEKLPIVELVQDVAGVVLDDEGKIKEDLLPGEKRPTRIDLSQYESQGKIIEYYEDDSTVEHTVEFSNGKPVSVTTNGVTTTLEW